MNAKFKEAMAALERMRRESDDWFAVKAVIETAQQEADDWEAIESAVALCKTDCSQVALRIAHRMIHAGSDRVEAIREVAEWCRAAPANEPATEKPKPLFKTAVLTRSHVYLACLPHDHSSGRGYCPACVAQDPANVDTVVGEDTTVFTIWRPGTRPG